MGSTRFFEGFYVSVGCNKPSRRVIKSSWEVLDFFEGVYVSVGHIRSSRSVILASSKVLDFFLKKLMPVREVLDQAEGLFSHLRRY